MASSSTTNIDKQEEAKEKNIAEERNNRTIAIPEDNYKWRICGRQGYYVHKIKKFRTYLRCVNKNCKAKKNVDWPPNEPNNKTISYKGDHNHIMEAFNEEQVQEQNIAVAFNNDPIVFLEDGYKWKKYGQKYIGSIQKNRSYFRCVNKNCKAKKKMEWPPNDPNNIDIAYEGDHNHRALFCHLENGYKWKEYRQMYIRSIQKNRSYFRCEKYNCYARMKVDWPPNEPNTIDISYEEDHNHRAFAAGQNSENNEEDGIAANQYDLTTDLKLGPSNQN